MGFVRSDALCMLLKSRHSSPKISLPIVVDIKFSSNIKTYPFDGTRRLVITAAMIRQMPIILRELILLFSGYGAR